MTERKKTIEAVMLGHAVGDALGVPVEFFMREELEEAVRWIMIRSWTTL